MVRLTAAGAVAALGLAVPSGAFVTPAAPRAAAARAHAPLRMGLFDSFRDGITGGSSKDWNWEAQQEILNRRRNKGAMKKYKASVEEGRKKADEKVTKFGWQNVVDGTDPLAKWKKMKADGKLDPIYDEGENEDGGIPIPMASFGVGGSFGQGGKWDEGGRFDLRLPYVDQGYVDEDADFMGKLFGKKKKKKVPEPEKKEEAPKKKGWW